MGCTTCKTGSCTTTTKGCNNNGGCGSGGCNKVNTFDWLGNMQQPWQREDQNVYEVRFKNTRKAFFKNVNRLNLMTGDIVAVESDRGFDVGQISLSGVLARLQMKKRKVDENSDKVRKIFRLASEEDVEKLRRARQREQETLVRTRAIITSLKLDMKLSEVEFQGDNTKAIFYYIADQRVDFRELIKILAGEFKIRVEMKQIGLRHEAGLVGGIGSCGRELCCSTWLSDFRSVGTAAARYQNLSLNPMKISGQCGRLKCCLNYELDAYLDALKGIPEVTRIETEIGMATLQKTDIFLRKMWFSYEGDSNWIPLTVEEVFALSAMNKRGEKPATLQALSDPEKVKAADKPLDFVDVVGQAKVRDDRRKKKKKKPGQQQGQGEPRNQGPRQQGPQQQRGPQQEKTPGEEGKGPENQQRKGPRPENQQRGPRPENRNQNRGPRPERKPGEEGNPENKNQQRGPRPQQGPPREKGPGNQNPNQNRGPRNKNKNRGPRRDGPGNENKGGGNNNPPPATPPPPQQ